MERWVACSWVSCAGPTQEDINYHDSFLVLKFCITWTAGKLYSSDWRNFGLKVGRGNICKL